jgi:L-lactate dehydrogenase (cytochrome)
MKFSEEERSGMPATEGVIAEQTAASPAPSIQAARATIGPEAPVPRSLRRYLSLDDFEPAARRRLPRPIFGFIAGGVETDASLRANRAAFDGYGFVPRTLVDVSARTASTSVFGREYAAPFGIAPMGISAIAARDADIVLAQAAAASGIPFILSASSLTRLEDVRRAGATAWYQAYVPADPSRIEPLADRVAAAGFETFVLTVDVPVSANRENNVRNGFSIPLRPTPYLAWQGITHPRWLVGTALRTLLRRGVPHFENMDAYRGPPILSRNLSRSFDARDQLSWRHLEVIRRRWRGTLVVKGLLAIEDIRLAREHGADGVIVSNHGGRQLDGAVAPLDILPSVLAEAGEMAVMLDSGIRRGTDVLKALALGARFVFVGRPFLYAAAVAEEAGVRHAIRLLQNEIKRDMALLGVTSLSAMGPELLRQRR